ncbi:hypothetical protein [Parapedobacter lycopersici]|uniref:hypothetical protein n=1 Tax=Parapedobacter lycopersici TaxID=1864939 RepID=UPI00333F909F
MTNLPAEIVERFYLTLNGDIPIEAFEKWLYADRTLEQYLNPDDYLDLISLGFKKSGAKYELWKLLKKHIDLADFETYKLRNLLQEARLKTERLPQVLVAFYELYCDGYYFLQQLAIGYGLAIQVPQVENTTAETWDELNAMEKKALLKSLEQGLDDEVDLVLGWLESGKIKLTGEIDEMGRYMYDDFRTQGDRD